VIWLQERYLSIAQEGRFPVEESNTDLLSCLGITWARWLELWSAYGRVYSTYRWFSRAWVVQEFFLAGDVRFRCGEETIDCEILEQLTQQGMAVGSLIKADAKRFAALSVYQSLMADEVGWEEKEIGLSLITGSKTTEERWYSLILELVDMISLQRARCLHDKIYAVFGISIKLQPTSLRHANCLGVNYQQSVEDTLSLFTTGLLRYLPTLAVLSYVSPSSHDVIRNSLTLPSWCPDYSARSPLAPLLGWNQFVSDPAQAFSASKSLVRE
jgi:hypothetical protein